MCFIILTFNYLYKHAVYAIILFFEFVFQNAL